MLGTILRSEPIYASAAPRPDSSWARSGYLKLSSTDTRKIRPERDDLTLLPTYRVSTDLSPQPFPHAIDSFIDRFQNRFCRFEQCASKSSDLEAD